MAATAVARPVTDDDLFAQQFSPRAKHVPVSDALRVVNAHRAVRGLYPIHEMPKGERRCGSRCVLAHALGADMVEPWCTLVYTAGGRSHRLPPKLAQFARDFDRGYYPELEIL